MKALVHDGSGHIALEDRPEPQLQLPTDAIIRVTRSTICTSDLHIIHGAVPRATPNTVLGHEFVGVVEQVGEGVHALKPGDRVAVSCETFCGECFYCERGWVNNCVEGGWGSVAARTVARPSLCAWAMRTMRARPSLRA